MSKGCLKMAKTDLNRLIEKYGQTNITGKRYQELMAQIIARNSRNIMNSIGRISERNMRRQIKNITDAETKRPVTVVFPPYEEILPKKRPMINKSFEKGKKINDTLKSRLTNDLRNSIKGFEIEGKRYRGRLRPEMIKNFEKQLKQTFQEYTKKDPKFGMPTNIHSIAVTEMRSAVNEMRDDYIKEVLDRNDHLEAWKYWIHNKSLSKEPRPGHMAMHMKKVRFDELFTVPTYKKTKGRWVRTGTIKMSRPHDPNAPIGEKITCSCELKYTMRVKPKKKGSKK
jgi:hypothetical protein